METTSRVSVDDFDLSEDGSRRNGDGRHTDEHEIHQHDREGEDADAAGVLDVAHNGHNGHHHEHGHDHDHDHEHMTAEDLAELKDKGLRRALWAGALGSLALAYVSHRGGVDHDSPALLSSSSHEVADGAVHTMRLTAGYLLARGREKGANAAMRAAGVGVAIAGGMAGWHAYEEVGDLWEDPSDALSTSFSAGRYAVANALGNLAIGAGLIRASRRAQKFEHDIGEHSEADVQEGYGVALATVNPLVGGAMVADAAGRNAYHGARRMFDPEYEGGHNHGGELAVDSPYFAVRALKRGVNSFNKARRVVLGGLAKHSIEGTIRAMDKASEVMGEVRTVASRESLRATMGAMERTRAAMDGLSARGGFAAGVLSTVALGAGVYVSRQGFDIQPAASALNFDVAGTVPLDMPLSDMLSPEVPIEPFVDSAPTEIPDINFVDIPQPEATDPLDLDIPDVPAYEAPDLTASEPSLTEPPVEEPFWEWQSVEEPDFVILEAYDHETKDGTIWNIARDIIGPDASIAEINDLKNEILERNNLSEEQARRLSPGFKVLLPEGVDTPVS